MNGEMISNLCRAVTIVKERFEQGDKLACIDISLAITIPSEINSVVGVDIMHPVNESKHPYVKFIRPQHGQENYVWVYSSEDEDGMALDLSSDNFTELLNQW